MNEPTLAELVASVPPNRRADFEALVRQLAKAMGGGVGSAGAIRGRRARAKPNPPAPLPEGVSAGDVRRVEGALRVRGLG